LQRLGINRAIISGLIILLPSLHITLLADSFRPIKFAAFLIITALIAISTESLRLPKNAWLLFPIFLALEPNSPSILLLAAILMTMSDFLQKKNFDWEIAISTFLPILFWLIYNVEYPKKFISTFGNRSYLSSFLAAAIPYTVKFSPPLAYLSTLIISFSGCRASTLALMLISTIAISRKFYPKQFANILLLLTLSIPIFFIYKSGIATRNWTPSANAERVKIVTNCINIALKKPMGIGIGNTPSKLLEESLKHDFPVIRTDWCHNEYIQTIVEMGILGLFPIVFFIIPLIHILTNPKIPPNSHKLLYTLSLTSIAFESLVFFPLHIPPVAFIALYSFTKLISKSSSKPTKLINGVWKVVKYFIALSLLVNAAFIIWKARIYREFLDKPSLQNAQKVLKFKFDPFLAFKAGFIAQQNADLKNAVKFYAMSALPEAKFNLSLILLQLNEKKQACKILRQLSSQYPWFDKANKLYKKACLKSPYHHSTKSRSKTSNTSSSM